MNICLSNIYFLVSFIIYSSDFAEHLFSKSISWSLIASLLAFSGGLAIECTRNGRSILVRSVCDWATVFIVIRLKEWVKQNGGWVSKIYLTRLTNHVIDHVINHML